MKDAVAQLAEIRIVQLVQAVEDALEVVSHRLVNALDDETAKALGTQILAKGPAHQRMEEMAAAMTVDLEQWLDGMRREQILQALMDTERAAHDFYREILDDVRDAKLSEILIALMREEAQHVAAVDRARKGR